MAHLSILELATDMGLILIPGSAKHQSSSCCPSSEVFLAGNEWSSQQTSEFRGWGCKNAQWSACSWVEDTTSCEEMRSANYRRNPRLATHSAHSKSCDNCCHASVDPGGRHQSCCPRRRDSYVYRTLPGNNTQRHVCELIPLSTQQRPCQPSSPVAKHVFTSA